MNKQIWIVLAIGLGVGFMAGYLNLPHTDPQPTATGGANAPTRADARKPIFYRSPMNPAVTSPVPAKDNMGMDYIAVYADAGSGSDGPVGTVIIDPVAVQNIGVRTAIAQRRNLTREIRTVGRVAYDEQRVARLHPKIEGWIEELFVSSTGSQVSANAMLLGLYSPQLVSTQEEYLLALKNRDRLADSPYPDIRAGAEALMESTRKRLQLLDVPDHQIAELEASQQTKKTLHIHSPFDGVVINVGARQGEFVTPKTELYTIADLSKVWVFVDVYEADLFWVKAGDHAVMNLAAVPGRTFDGLITYVYPYMDPTTRTAKVRLEFPNPNLDLKPDMFTDVTIHADRQVDAVVIPAEAVVRSGATNQVFVVRGPGKFSPRSVVLGVTAEGLVQVVEGLQAGEEVVTSAQFLIDSESKLREATAKMMESTSSYAAPAAMGNTKDEMGGMQGQMGDVQGHDTGDMKNQMGDMQSHDMGGMKGQKGDMQGHDMGGMKGQMGSMKDHGMGSGR